MTERMPFIFNPAAGPRGRKRAEKAIRILAGFVVAANSRYYGGRFGPTPTASMTDGLLDVCVLREKSLTRMVDFWYKALMADGLDSSRVDYFRTAELEVTSPDDSPVPLQVDGELAGELPARITVEKEALQVCVGAGR